MCQFGPPETVVNPNNPYAQFKCCCSMFNIRDHAQLCGVLSFTLFLCLVLISMMVFGSLSLFYIVLGVVVYSLLIKTLFGVINKLSLLFYLFFEAIQIGFYLALMLYIIFPLLFLQIPRRNCYNTADKSNESVHYSQICDEPKSQAEDYVELLLFVSLLASIKLHFARVFAHFYKYLTWNEQNSLHRAQYINGRGIHFSMDRAPSVLPHFGWDTHSAKDVERGQQQQNGPNNFSQMPISEMPPTYAQVMEGQQQKRTEEQQGTEGEKKRERDNGSGRERQ